MRNKPATYAKILVALGTRPEVIKLAPVIQEMRRREDEFEVIVCSTGQHREMVAQAAGAFSLALDIEMATMRHGQSLADLTAALFKQFGAALERERPNWVMVQGDTTSAMVAGLCAFYANMPVAHVEAGLRTRNVSAPFPEEVNRRILGQIADLHLAPTDRARRNLRDEGVREDQILLTGNTVVDAVRSAQARVAQGPPGSLPPSLIAAMSGKRILLVTCHRRESFGGPLEEVCLALGDVCDRRSDVLIVFPVHLNRVVRVAVQRTLAKRARIALTEPLDYLSLIWLMTHSALVLTDSGGLQEEAATLRKPVLVTRDLTERPELIELGLGRLVGTRRRSIADAVDQILDNREVYESMTRAKNPFGDGRAASRVVAGLRERIRARLAGSTG